MSAIPIEETLKYVNEARMRPQDFSKYVEKEIGLFLNNHELPLMPGCNYRVN